MALLIFYVLLALGVSFLCSILEATLLTVTPANLAAAQTKGARWAHKMTELKEDIERPLAAILTLNTVAHTMGAAGAGAQWAKITGNTYEAVFSAALTLAVLVFTEIIPKTLGARYAMFFARPVAHLLPVMQVALAPLVVVSKWITRLITFGKAAAAEPMHREELLAATQIGEAEGAIGAQESMVVKNILRLHEMPVSSIMTPRTVLFALPQSLSLEEFVDRAADRPFSRVPIYGENRDDITGVVLRTDAFIARLRQVEGEAEVPATVESLKKPVELVPATMTVDTLFQTFADRGSHLKLVANEFGVLVGLVTLEDVLETIVGVEIIDETDEVADLQKFARDLWRKRASTKGIELPDEDEEEGADGGSGEGSGATRGEA